MPSQFVNLHVHSHYSLLDGLARIDGLVRMAKEFEMPALALTDHGSLYGAIEFYQTCKKEGIKPIIGVETYLTSRGRHRKMQREDDERFHLILLAKNNVGYHNLLKLVTLSHLEGFYYKPRVDFEILREYHEGIIATSACLNGQISQALLSGREALPILEQYRDIFGEDFYLEVQHHPNLPDQFTVNKGLIELSKKTGVPLIATGDSHYRVPEDAEAHDVLLCLQTKKERSDKNRLCMLGEDFSFQDGTQLIEAFPENPDAIFNTVKIAEQCELELTFGKTILPHYDIPDNRTAEDMLRQLCEEGLNARYGKDVTIDIKERLNYELKIILKAGFAAYFLIVQDIVNWAKRNGIVVGPGRGSAAGSLVSYLLNITNIDPLTYELLFERFLNPERISMPDIDLDFTDTRRDEVLAYVEQKYGKDHVAQIITFGTMAARVSIRDVGRVLGVPYNFCDSLAKLIPTHMTLQEAFCRVDEIRALYENNQQAKDIIDIARKLEGVARHTSVHACGVVITKESLSDHVPCQYASPDDKTIVTQYSLHPIEDLGLLKIDFLGLSNLTILEEAKKNIKRTRDVDIEFDKLPLNDRKTFRLLQQGKTTGVFQLESAGMKRYLKSLKPTEIEDIIAMVALYRPGPMELIPEYIAGKNHKKIPTYLHPKLKPILEKTYGIAVYQEQLLKIAQELAGFTLGEADVLRKAVGKKISKLLQEQKQKFIVGCVKNNVSKQLAETIFEFIEPFAGYGFNRSHAACYALIAYQTAYMKANFPAEFMAALLTSDQGNTDRIAIEIEECRQMGIEVLPPDINESFESFTVVPLREESQSKTIRFGLSAIKNVGEHVVAVIVTNREHNGHFSSLEDFLERIQDKDLNKKSLESLIRAGALDRFGDRNEMFYNSDKLLSFSKQLSASLQSKQASLFGAAFARASLILEKAPPLEGKTLLSWERELLGLYLSEHPLRQFEDVLSRFVMTCQNAKAVSSDKVVKICGIIIQSKKIMTKKGEPMLFVKIEDLTDTLEIIVFPSLLKETQHVWKDDAIIAVEGKVSLKDNEVKVICLNVKEINDKMMEYLRTLPTDSVSAVANAPTVPTARRKEFIQEDSEKDFIYEPDTNNF